MTLGVLSSHPVTTGSGSHGMRPEAHRDQVFRLLDANANRLREGVRTAEDYARFVAGE